MTVFSPRRSCQEIDVPDLKICVALPVEKGAANVLSEDTELTFRLKLAGWSVVYANRCECYEEVTQTWGARIRQIRRWAIGHTQCFVRFALPMLTRPGLRAIERIDGVMLLAIYLIAPLLTLEGLRLVWQAHQGD